MKLKGEKLRMTRNFHKLKRRRAFKAEVRHLEATGKQLRGTVVKRMLSGRAGMPYSIPTNRQRQIIRETA